MSCVLHHGDCRELLVTLPDYSVDSVVTDPPYELGFMGKSWDASGIAYSVEMWREVLRVLKPGGHLLAFGGTRTYHRMAVAIEDAGFEIRDSIHWVYGSGFPKSLDVSKAIDKAAGAEREVVGSVDVGPDIRGGNYENARGRMIADITSPATDAAKQWAGWGTALKPAHEPIVLARKPLIGTVAANVLQHGTGALNIDVCRVANTGQPIAQITGKGILGGTSDGYDRPWKNDPAAVAARQERANAAIEKANSIGRWPANIVFTHADGCQQTGTRSDAFNVVDGFRDYPQDSNFGARAQVVTQRGQSVEVPVWACVPGCPVAELDQQSGGASRFFTVTEWSELDVPFRYVAKPGEKERNAGLDGLPQRNKYKPGGTGGTGGLRSVEAATNATPVANHHPTVKPVALMRWLVRLVTPPNGTVLDPFLGSGTTLMAAALEGFNSIGIELTDDYLPIIKGRVAWAENQPKPEPGPIQEELF